MEGVYGFELLGGILKGFSKQILNKKHKEYIVPVSWRWGHIYGSSFTLRISTGPPFLVATKGKP